MVIAAEVTLTSKGQMTLPKEMRDHLQIHTGDKVDVVMHDNRIVITPKVSLDELCNALPRPERAFTLDEIDQGIGAAVTERNRRSRSS